MQQICIGANWGPPPGPRRGVGEPRWLLLLCPFVAAAALADTTIPVFTEESIQRGLDFTMSTSPLVSGYGLALLDLDGDGDPDLVALGAVGGTVGVFENDGAGFFTDRSAASGLPSLAYPINVSGADWDDDGDVDLVFTGIYQSPRLFRNDGALFFTDVSAGCGMTTPSVGMGMSWGDADGDGWIDLYLAHYISGAPVVAATRNQLWRNDGDGHFTNIAASLGVDAKAASLVPALFDADDDGDLDIYLANDRGAGSQFLPNRFWRSDGGTFTEIGQQNGAGVGLCSMSVSIGDVDGDGRFDLYCTNNPSTLPPMYGQSPLLLRQPDGQYVQAQEAWGVGNVGDPRWASLFLDANNDGRLDLFVVRWSEADNLFLNAGTPPMTEVSKAAGVTGLAGWGYCAAMADVDGDGDIDLVTNPLGSTLQLLINHTIDAGTPNPSAHWCSFRVVGERHDAHAIGATLRITASGHEQRRQVTAGGNGYLNQNAFACHVGLGSSETIDEIEVRWPWTGSVRTLTNYAADAHWTLYPPSRLGDADDDGAVTQSDLSAISSRCGVAVSPGLEMLDLDGSGLLDSGDFLLAVTRLAGPIGDFDGSGIVDGDDLGSLLGGWGAAPSAYDLNCDGRVDGDDLGTLLGSWGR